MKKTFHLLIIFSAFVIASCNTASTDEKTAAATDTKDTPAFDIAAARTAIEAMNVKFGESFRKKDSTAIASYYTGDAWLLPPNSEPVKGSGILSLWGGFVNAGFSDLKLTTDEVTGNQDQVAEVGHYEIVGGDGKTADKGKYLVVWKPVDGGWKLHRDIWNSSLPAAH